MTSKGRGPFIALVLLCCTSEPPPVVGAVWPTRDFFRFPRATFSGFPTARLISMDGGIPWRTADFEANPPVSDGTWSLAVQPAFQNGDVAAYVVTEIWDTHPDPWIQPVYHINRNGMRVGGVFGVGVDSTFYSPYWRVYDAEQTTQEGPFNSVADIVDANLPLTKGPIWVCPLVPAEVTGFAASTGDGKPRRPLTLEEVTAPEVGVAWADGVVAPFLNFGERQVGQIYEDGADGTVEAADFYVFARAEADGGRTVLELPAVLTDGAQVHAYVRRVDVVLEGEAVFVPPDAGALRAHVQQVLGDAGYVPVPNFDISPDLAAKYTLRVASDATCLIDGGFPDKCTWLDSDSAIEDGLPPSRVLDTSVTLTATPVLLGGKPL